MNITELFQLPHNVFDALAGFGNGVWAGVICSTTVYTSILAVILLCAIRLTGPFCSER